jgi:flagellar hook-length control protein FliK
MTSIQSPVTPSTPPANAAANAAANGDDACPDQDNEFAKVLRGKQNPPRREATAERARNPLPGADAAPATADSAVADLATPGLDTSTLPPDLAAALAQIGAQASGHGRQAADGKRAFDATGDAGSPGRRDAAGVDPALMASRFDDAAARAAQSAPTPALPVSTDPRQTVAGDLAAPGTRFARADGVIARPAMQVVAPQGESAPATRFESVLEKVAMENGGPNHASSGLEAAPPGATAMPGWAAAAVPADGGVARAPTPAQHVATIDAPVGSQRFADQTAQQVTWMAKNGLSEAEIRVKPAELGPISVRIEMNQNEAVINFAVTQPETRAAVQDSLHRLQEMLAESGISLGEANVGGQGQAGQFGERTGSGTRSRVTFPGSGDPVGALAAVPRGTASARGLVDTFA